MTYLMMTPSRHLREQTHRLLATGVSWPGEPKVTVTELVDQITGEGGMAIVNQLRAGQIAHLPLVFGRLTDFGFLLPPVVLLGHFPAIQSNKSSREINEF